MLGEGGMGRGSHPCLGLYLPNDVVCAPIILCSNVWGVAHLGGVDGKAVLL